MKKLDDYASLIGEAGVEEIRQEAEDLEGKSFAHVNATFYGGGVAEMLNSYVPLLNDAGVNTEWRLIKGSKEFFTITKQIHNSLQGGKESLSKEEIDLFEKAVEENSRFMDLKWYDSVVIDDPQPAPLINHYPRTSPAFWKPLPVLLELETYQKKQPWILRMHIDLTASNPKTFKYFKSLAEKYDALVVSKQEYAKNIRKPIFVIPPAIDPFSDKNRELKSYESSRILEKHDIDARTPIVLQVSRFDIWKDPLGVIEAFKLVREKVKCQLILIGSHAADDPESEEVFNQAYKAAEKNKDVTLITLQNDLLVNALQREAAVVIQKSLREGFGLTVSEALWKNTPVVASNVGGIPLQIEDGKNGFLVNNVRECALKTEYLLKNPQIARQMGEHGRAKVMREFLITRLVKDEIELLKEMSRTTHTIKPPRALQQVIHAFKKTPDFLKKGLHLFRLSPSKRNIK